VGALVSLPVLQKRAGKDHKSYVMIAFGPRPNPPSLLGEGAHRHRLERMNSLTPLKFQHRLVTGDQAFGGVIGRHFDQRAVELDTPLPCGARGFERRDKAARAGQLWSSGERMPLTIDACAGATMLFAT
jgi:hypothetical protein